jgi:hypothetical protein
MKIGAIRALRTLPGLLHQPIAILEYVGEFHPALCADLRNSALIVTF